jgi:hypothetical protein
MFLEDFWNKNMALFHMDRQPALALAWRTPLAGESRPPVLTGLTQ